MRWIFGGATALFLLWLGFVASPYVAAIKLASAVFRQDGEQLEERVNLRAVRAALTKQLVDEALAQKGSGGLSNSDAELLKATVASAAEPVLATLVTARGVSGLLEFGPLGAAAAPGLLAALGRAPDQALALLTSSRWRGFRNVYISVPAGRPSERETRLQLRLTRLVWRLVGIELPRAEKARLVAAILAAKDPPESSLLAPPDPVPNSR